MQLKKFLAFGVRLLNKHAPDTFTFPKRKSEKMNKNLFVKELKTVFHLDDLCLQKFRNKLEYFEDWSVSFALISCANKYNVVVKLKKDYENRS